LDFASFGYSLFAYWKTASNNWLVVISHRYTTAAAAAWPKKPQVKLRCDLPLPMLASTDEIKWLARINVRADIQSVILSWQVGCWPAELKYFLGRWDFFNQKCVAYRMANAHNCQARSLNTFCSSRPNTNWFRLMV
jgi:hypothetical protein